jgi:regulator of sigma D
MPPDVMKTKLKVDNKAKKALNMIDESLEDRQYLEDIFMQYVMKQTSEIKVNLV